MAARRRLLSLQFFDQLPNLGIFGYGLNKDDVIPVQHHMIRLVQLLATPDEHRPHLLRLLVHRALDIEDLAEDGGVGFEVFEFPEIDRAVVQKDGLIRGVEPHRIVGLGRPGFRLTATAQNERSGEEQDPAATLNRTK